MAWKLQYVQRKMLVFVHFETLELNFPNMAFLGTFWKAQNREQIMKFNQHRSEFQTAWIGFSKESADRAWFETSENHSFGIDPNRLESVQTAKKRLEFEVSRASRPIRPQNSPRAFGCTRTGMLSLLKRAVRMQHRGQRLYIQKLHPKVPKTFTTQ